MAKPFSARVQFGDVRTPVLKPARMPAGYVSMIFERSPRVVFSATVDFAGAVSGGGYGKLMPTFTITTSSLGPCSLIFNLTLVDFEVDEEPAPVYGMVKVEIWQASVSTAEFRKGSRKEVRLLQRV